MQTHAYLEHARHCARMAEQCGSAEAKRLRLSEARDWFALAAAHDQRLPPEDEEWSPLEPLDRARHPARDVAGAPPPDDAGRPV